MVDADWNSEEREHNQCSAEGLVVVHVLRIIMDAMAATLQPGLLVKVRSQRASTSVAANCIAEIETCSACLLSAYREPPDTAQVAAQS